MSLRRPRAPCSPRSRLETRRRFVEFCTALAVFGLYSELYGRDYEAGAMPRREVGDGA